MLFWLYLLFLQLFMRFLHNKNDVDNGFSFICCMTFSQQLCLIFFSFIRFFVCVLLVFCLPNQTNTKYTWGNNNLPFFIYYYYFHILHGYANFIFSFILCERIRADGFTHTLTHIFHVICLAHRIYYYYYYCCISFNMNHNINIREQIFLLRRGRSINIKLSVLFLFDGKL